MFSRLELVAHNMRKNILKDQYGFSLIETLIAISILMIAITGPLALVQAGLFSANHQRNQVTATYLAQEALEFIKNVRDSNFYKNYGKSDSAANWLTGPDETTPPTSLLTSCGGSDGCYVDPHKKLSGDAFVLPVVAPVLYLRQTNINAVILYSYDTTGTETSYKRTVKITSVADPDEVKVSVTMDWKDNGLSRTYTVSENIYNYEQ